MVSAVIFREAFLKAYRDIRQSFGDTEWKKSWHLGRKERGNWNDIMLYGGAFGQPAVLTDTAHSFAPPLQHCGIDRLVLWDREPLHLDAVFVPGDQTQWFPMLVAIEHENDPSNFSQEVRKLLSVRAPLKVGITYGFRPNDPTETALRNDFTRKVVDDVRQQFRLMDVNEDCNTEYLFLLGSCVGECAIEWRSLTIGAGMNLEALAFE